MKNRYWIGTGIFAILTATLHTVGGQIKLINPILDAQIESQVKTEMLGAWHVITLLLYLSSFYFLGAGFGMIKNPISTIKTISWCFILSGLPFIIVSIIELQFAPQFILLLPIGLFGLKGLLSQIKKQGQ